MLIRAFEVHDAVTPTIVHPVDAGKARECLRILEREGVRRPGIEPDVEHVRHLFPVVELSVGNDAFEKTLFRALFEPDIGTVLRKRRFNARDKFIRFSEVGPGNDVVGFTMTEHRDRHAPRRADATPPSPGGSQSYR